MTNKLTKEAFSNLVKEDIEWLLQQIRTFERDHIEGILKECVEMYYNNGWDHHMDDIHDHDWEY